MPGGCALALAALALAALAHAAAAVGSPEDVTIGYGRDGVSECHYHADGIPR